jgi:hypothetical protein
MLLGRGPETTRLDELIRDAADGRGGALVIEGVPGVGKTALLEDAAQRAPQLSVLRVAGVESELALPYAALHQLCARMIGRRDRLPTPQADAIAVALGGLAGRPPDRFLVSLGALGLLSDLAGNDLSCVSSMMRSGSTRSPFKRSHLSRGARRQTLSRLSSQPARP